MLWAWTTQAGNTFNVTLKDSVTTYINNAARASTDPLPVIAGGSAVNGSGLALTINCAQASSLRCIATSNNIVDPTLGVVATTYTVIGEDAGDNDYNDVYFSVTFWKGRG